MSAWDDACSLWQAAEEQAAAIADFDGPDGIDLVALDLPGLDPADIDDSRVYAEIERALLQGTCRTDVAVDLEVIDTCSIGERELAVVEWDGYEVAIVGAPPPTPFAAGPNARADEVVSGLDVVQTLAGHDLGLLVSLRGPLFRFDPTAVNSLAHGLRYEHDGRAVIDDVVQFTAPPVSDNGRAALRAWTAVSREVDRLDAVGVEWVDGRSRTLFVIDDRSMRRSERYDFLDHVARDFFDNVTRYGVTIGDHDPYFVLASAFTTARYAAWSTSFGRTPERGRDLGWEL